MSKLPLGWGRYTSLPDNVGYYWPVAMWEPNLQLCQEFIKAGIGLNGNSKLHTKRDGYHSRDRGHRLNASMLGKSEQTSENVKWVSCVFILMILGVWMSEWVSQARICAYYMQNMWRRWRNDKKRIFRISQAGGVLVVIPKPDTW